MASDPDRSIGAVEDRSNLVLGRTPDIVQRFVSMSLSSTTLHTVLDELGAQSRPTGVTMITLEPGALPGSRSNTLARIAGGELDGELRDIAGDLSRFRGTVALRFAHEMNGDWYPWAGQPSTYVAAWDRLAGIMRQDAPGVRLVWSVTADDRPAPNTFERYWPGPDKVDVIGVDGYNCLAGWQTPEQIFGGALDRLRRLSDTLPVWITETGSCEASALPGTPASETKAAWIGELFALAKQRRLGAVVWFDRDKEYDWRIDTSPDARAALEKALAGRGAQPQE